MITVYVDLYEPSELVRLVISLKNKHLPETDSQNVYKRDKHTVLEEIISSNFLAALLLSTCLLLLTVHVDFDMNCDFEIATISKRLKCVKLLVGSTIS